MSDKIHLPDECQTMADVRAGIDTLDAEIVALLARRFGYMRAAARIKTQRADVRDEARKAQVIDNARKVAAQLELPDDVIADIWERLVEGSIEYELTQWDRTRG